VPRTHRGCRAGGTGTRCTERVHRRGNGLDVGGRVEREHLLLVDVDVGPEVVQLLAVDEDPGVETLTPLYPGNDADERVLEDVHATSLGSQVVDALALASRYVT